MKIHPEESTENSEHPRTIYELGRFTVNIFLWIPTTLQGGKNVWACEHLKIGLQFSFPQQTLVQEPSRERHKQQDERVGLCSFHSKFGGKAESWEKKTNRTERTFVTGFRESFPRSSYDTSYGRKKKHVDWKREAVVLFCSFYNPQLSQPQTRTVSSKPCISFFFLEEYTTHTYLTRKKYEVTTKTTMACTVHI